MENEIAYMKEHPPRCLGTDCKPSPKELIIFLQKILGEGSTVFTPVCECSQEFLNIASSPDLVTISCPKCGHSRIVFDPTQHGFDGELNDMPEFEKEPTQEVTCLKCGSKDHRVALCFQYSGETDVLEDDDAPDVKPEDIFGWITIAAQCENCQAIQEFYNHECA